MGFYLRKSLSFGPLRFNLSKSGVGISAGVKGLRFGTGPRGNYVHMGRGGIYYRATLPSGQRARSQPRQNSPNPTAFNPTEAISPPALEEIESASAAAMTDASSADLLAEINAKRNRWRTWPIAAALTLLATVLVLPQSKAEPVLVVLPALLLGLTVGAFVWDGRRKTTVLFYELDEPPIAACEAFHRGFEQLGACQRVWHITAQGAVRERKYHAGASSTVNRTAVALTAKAPPMIRTNVAVACIPVGRQHLYLFPDRALFYDAGGVGAIDYKDLHLTTETTRFIESETVPPDAQVVARTWQYVNKNGGPDRRFTNNRELPIALYEEVTLRSRTGLNEKLQVSRVGAAAALISGITAMAGALAKTRQPQSQSSPTHPIRTEQCAVASPAVAKSDSPSLERRCFYYFANSVQGPVSRSELLSLVATGVIGQEMLVCSEEDQNWVAYSKILT